MVTCLVRMFITFAYVSPTLLLLNHPVSFDSNTKCLISIGLILKTYIAAGCAIGEGMCHCYLINCTFSTWVCMYIYYTDDMYISIIYIYPVFLCYQTLVKLM